MHSGYTCNGHQITSENCTNSERVKHEGRKEETREVMFTSGADGENEDQAYQLFQQHSLHWEDLVCWQIQAKQHPSIHPEKKKKLSLVYKALVRVRPVSVCMRYR